MRSSVVSFRTRNSYSKKQSTYEGNIFLLQRWFFPSYRLRTEAKMKLEELFYVSDYTPQGTSIHALTEWENWTKSCRKIPSKQVYAPQKPKCNLDLTTFMSRDVMLEHCSGPLSLASAKFFHSNWLGMNLSDHKQPDNAPLLLKWCMRSI